MLHLLLVLLPSSVRSAERSQSEMRAELSQQRGRALEEQKKRESQDALVRRLQKRVLLLTKVLSQQTRTREPIRNAGFPPITPRHDVNPDRLT